MREIKFRALVNNYWTDWLPNDVIYGEQNTILIDPKEYEADNCVIEQYTGLKDKNGKEIYEGDIVDQSWEEGTHIVWEVRWRQDEARFELHWISGVEFDDSPMCALAQEEYEVIGNIHENPELLK